MSFMLAVAPICWLAPTTVKLLMLLKLLKALKLALPMF